MKSKIVIIIGLGLMLPLFSLAQLPRYVLGSGAGCDIAGGEYYIYQVGEPVIGTENWGGGIHTMGFLQPELQSVLPIGAKLEISGEWKESPVLQVNLQSNQGVYQYVVLRGLDLHSLAPLQWIDSNGLFFSWEDLFEPQLSSGWYYQVRARLIDGREIHSNILELNRVSADLRWHVYPNPASGQLTLNISGLELQKPIRLEVQNALGQIIYQDEWQAPTVHYVDELSVDQWAEGIYWLRCHTPTGMLEERVIVQH